MSDTYLKVLGIKKVFYAKKKAKVALDSISFDLKRGEIFSLLGVNGAGKTTLSNIIATLHPPTQGEITWDGLSIYKNIVNYRKIIGYCPQHPNLDKTLSLEESLVFAGKCYGLTKKEADNKKDKLIETLLLKSHIKSFVEHLSGGYRQRFLIARTLMHSPKIVILDEPTVGLDPLIRHQLWDIIRQLKNDGISVILTTHYLEEAENLSDRVCMIHEGIIRAIDTPDHLIQKHEKKSLEAVFLKLANKPSSFKKDSSILMEDI